MITSVKIEIYFAIDGCHCHMGDGVTVSVKQNHVYVYKEIQQDL